MYYSSVCTFFILWTIYWNVYLNREYCHLASVFVTPHFVLTTVASNPVLWNTFTKNRNLQFTVRFSLTFWLATRNIGWRYSVSNFYFVKFEFRNFEFHIALYKLPYCSLTFGTNIISTCVIATHTSVTYSPWREWEGDIDMRERESTTAWELEQQLPAMAVSFTAFMFTKKIRIYTTVATNL